MLSEAGDSEGGTNLRVFVNNQNTRTAVVTLPSSVPRDRQMRIIGEGANAELKRGGFGRCNAQPGGDFTAAGGLAQLRKNANVPGITREDVHPQLEDVYQRVMRRLQRRANYAEIGCPPLAVQFGIVDSGDEERSREKNDWDSDERHTSLQSTSSTGTQTRVASPKRKQQHGRGVVKPSALAADGTRDDDALFLSQQPCPGTLRLVLEQVAATVAEKLRLADTGSLKKCLCLVFESRSLLDRLLKEIPLYSQFQGEGERLPTAFHIQELFQEFRRQPVVVPAARFEKEPSNGHVIAALVDDGRCALSPLPPAGSGGELQAPAGDASEKSLSASVSIETVAFEPPDGSQKVAHLGGVAIPIPATYGKSMRTQEAVGGGGGGRKRPLRTGAGSGVARSKVRFSVGNVDRRKQQSSLPPRDAAAASCLKKADDPLSPGMSTTNTITSTTSSGPDASALPSSTGGVGGGDAAVSNPLSLTEKKRRKTQVMSVSTITDINYLTVVNREEYDELQAYAKSLLVEIEERKQDVRELRKELEEEREYTSQKKKVVQYLRETLYKECNALRAQLSSAQQKQIQYQALLREKQQALAHAATAMSAEARSGASVSTYDGSRLPNISPSRTGVNEMSVMGLSFNPAMQSLKRGNQNVSVFSFVRGSAHIEDNEEGYGSVVEANGSVVGTSRQISVDITAIQSLLDLVLLAVENDQMLPSNAAKIKGGNMSIVANAMVDEGHKREEMLRQDFLERRRQIKQNFSLGRAEMTSILDMKERQIESLKKSSDIHFLKKYWEEKSSILRDDLRSARKAVQDCLNSLKQFMIITMESIIKRTHVVDATLGENHDLYSTQSALRDAISSAHSLVVPMLTTEYERGYHPWPLKLRNTGDPFGRMIKARYGESQLMLVREEINILSSIYLSVHHYVMKNVNLPVVKRPMPGKTMHNLCSMMVLNSGASPEMWTQVRDRYLRDYQIQKSIAELNVSIVWLMYRQRMLTERSADAMQEAGMDPRLTSLPVQRTVNMIAEKLHKAVAERATLRKQRLENARDVYRIWKKRQIDLYEGYPPPTPPQRLVVAEMGAGQQGVLLATSPAPSHSRMNSQVHSSFSAGTNVNFWNRMFSASGESRNEAAVPVEGEEGGEVEQVAQKQAEKEEEVMHGNDEAQEDTSRTNLVGSN